MSAYLEQEMPEPKTRTKQGWKFSELLADPEVKERWDKVRQYFFLRESTYDMTSRCNISCDGCYYYKGEKQSTQDNTDPESWRKLMQQERERGITYVVLAGAEPSLTPALCEVCHAEIPWGTIATNGLKYIPASIDYKIHISVWGNDQTSSRVRNARDMLVRQVDLYRDDPRAVFIYTFTRHNIEEAEEVTRYLAENNCQVSFNMFSAPVGYQGDLSHNSASLKRTRDQIADLMQKFPQSVIYSYYNIVAHTHSLGLHDLYSCPYPRKNPSQTLGLGRSFRQYRTDLSWNRETACCVPDTDCSDCRHYAAGSAVVTSKLFRHATDPDTFRSWLDYVDTYLAVWVKGYVQGPLLCKKYVPPPGQDSFD